jgi:hypothetical protein
MYLLSSLSTRSVVSRLKKFGIRHAFILAAIILCLPLVAFAQEASIVGTVTDPSGSVVPNVKISITSAETGLVRTITTNDVGQYVVPDLHVGHYSIKAEASGFKTSTQKDVVLQVGDRLRLDFQMQLGGATETVTVEANAVRVQTDSGERSNVITSEQVSQLAVNGRSVYQLAALAPGAISRITGYVNTPVGGDAGVEFNGLRQNHNIYLLDGGENDDRGGAGGMSIAPSTDAIGEFRQLTSNYSADYGLSSGGTMTMVLKSGTSTLHASAWEFNRNDALDARNFFNPEPQKVAKLRLNVFGFNVGGPVTFGKLYNPEKKKTFFFYNMEWRRLIQGGLTNQHVPDSSFYPNATTGDANFGTTVVNVPTAAQVSSSVLFANCPGGTAPAGVVQGSPFPNNTIPACMINANMKSLLEAGIFPGSNAVDSQGRATFIGGNDSPTNLKEEIVRIDHNFSSKFSVFGHFVAEQVSQGFGISQWSGANVPTVGDTFGNPSYSAVIHTTYMISPSLLNEVAFNYNGNRINIIPFAGSGLASLSLPTGYDSTNSRLFTGPNNMDRIPNVDLNGSTGSHFEISSWPWVNKADDYQIRDDVSWTHGAHQFRMGASWAIYKKVQDLFGQTQGSFNYDGTFTGNDFGDFLLGDAKSYSELAVQDHGFWNNVSWAAYFQDNWRVNNKLTLNLGLRWDGAPHTYEANNRMGNFYPELYNPADAAVFATNNTICGGPFDPVTGANPGCTAASPGLGTSPNPILAGVPLYLNGIGIPEQGGVPKGLVDNNWGAFGPRIGFAYDLTGAGKTVIRGGFGIMYERIQGNDMYNAGPNIPFSLTVTNNSVDATNPSVALSNGAAVVQPINPADITGLERDNYKMPASYQWSIGVQHQLNPGSVLSVSYVGNQNRHQNDYRQINLPDPSAIPALIGGANYSTSGLAFPGFHGINMAEDEANSHYNALQLDLNSRVGHDLQFRAMYTLSRTIDPTSAGNGGGDLGSVSNPYAGWVYDVGPSGYDVTHNAAVNFIYDIPLFRTSSNAFVRTLVGGWSVSGIVTITSGFPINLGISGPQGGNGLPNTSNRPDLTGSISYPHHVGEWFDTSAFALPTLGAFGNLGHNALRGPGRDNWNLSLFKSFIFSEARGSRFEFRVETFNTWNHTEFNAVNGTFGGGQFGQVTSAFDPRIFQLGAKLYF